MSAKEGIRKEMLAKLRRMTPEEMALAGREIEKRIFQLPRMEGVRAILLYASLPREVPTEGIAAEARRRGIEVVYPRCLVEEREMALHLVQDENDLISGGRLGIREPAMSCPIRAMEDIDVAFIPGLGWDRQGNRLGRGAGYYDRLLANPAWRALRCGIFFAAQELPRVPTDEWEVPLEVVVTEEEVLKT